MLLNLYALSRIPGSLFLVAHHDFVDVLLQSLMLTKEDFGEKAAYLVEPVHASIYMGVVAEVASLPAEVVYSVWMIQVQQL